MVQFTLDTQVGASPDKAWKIIRDFGNIANYADGLSASRQTTDGDVGVGAERICDMKKPMMGKSQLHERVTAFSDDEMLLSVDVLGGMGPFKHMNGAFRVEPSGEGSRVSFTQTAKGGFMAKIMGGMANRPMKKGITEFLADVKTYVESQ